MYKSSLEIMIHLLEPLDGDGALASLNMSRIFSAHAGLLALRKHLMRLR